ncbi:uncharacterized protein LOC134188787 [Corticium candelabrum]|uniref:uncharacterized protein LOC134188787 n=1 Tax=Corticium candelabrum TaxID=121492 RepID=UPI002E2654C9|nr:uncharacterized protein LOC134188787 [Corticium candelabrum]
MRVESTVRLVTALVVVVAVRRPSSVDAAPTFRRSTFSISYLLNLGNGVQEKKTPVVQSPVTVLPAKYILPDQLTDALIIILGHVREANETAKRHATEAMSFIGVMNSPIQLERSATELMRELRHAWKGLRRHASVEAVQAVTDEYETWFKLLSQIVRKLKRARPAPAAAWLRSVHLNYTIQQHAYNQLKSQAIKLVWKASLNRHNDTAYVGAVANAMRSLSTDCQRIAPQIEATWSSSRRALAELSKPALNLDITMRSNSDRARVLVQQMRQTLLKPMARDLRTLGNKVEQNGSLYVTIASNIIGDWKTAVNDSHHRGFLLDQTPKQLGELNTLMRNLKKIVVNLAGDTVKLRQVVMDLLGYNKNKNSSKSPPPVLTEIDGLTSALKFFDSAPSIADGEKMVSDLLKRLRRLIKAIPS